MNTFEPPSRYRSPLVLVALALGMSGCAFLPRLHHVASIRPVQPAAQSMSRADGEYASIKAAIVRRDYGTALEMLQASRSRYPDDVRLINALGVVYDKLGRFDLSAVYYARAAALDPGSAIIANNVSYSATLQKPVLQAPVRLAQSPVPSGPTPVLEPAPRHEVPVLTVVTAKLETNALRPMTPLRRGYLGRPLVIANASGSPEQAETVRTALSRHGWATPTLTKVASEAGSRIEYSPDGAIVANALARTLPHDVQLIACKSTCDGVRLVMGADSTRWRMPIPGGRVQQ